MKRALRRLIITVVISSPASSLSTTADSSPGFTVAFGEEISDRAINFTAVPGGASRQFEVISGPPGKYRARLNDKALRPVGERRWMWQAEQQPGFHRLEVTSPTGGTMLLNLSVQRSIAELRNGELNGYRIGDYPKTPLHGLPIYEPPDGFIEVHDADLDLPVSPRFVLGQFLCKQPGGFPRYLVLQERLLLKLEYLLDRLNDAGLRVANFHVMSGYRTPEYNARIGNGHYSRHVWGGAADIFIDEQPRDGVMDDLNADGQVDHRDAIWLADFIAALEQRPDYRPFMGGLSAYDANAAHGPFVHVDVRGWQARW